MKKRTIKKVLAVLDPKPKRTSLSSLASLFPTKGLFDKRSVYILDKLRTVRLNFKKLESYITKQEKATDTRIKAIAKDIGKIERTIEEIPTKMEEQIKEIRELVLRQAQRGGGSMNRQIKVGGTDVLTRYTDINLVAGSGISIASANDTTDKNVDITFSSTGASPDVATDSLTGTASGNDVTLDLTGLTNTFVTILGVYRNGQLVSSGTSAGGDGSSRWSRSGNTVTIYNAADSDFYQVQYTF